MKEDDTFTKVAKTDFKIRLVTGFIFGVLSAIVSSIFIIVSLVSADYQLAVLLGVMVLVGAGVAASCGYFIFRKDNKEEKEEP